MSCRDVRDWLHREAASLDEGQRLQLDDHLASCADCRGDRQRLRAMHDLGGALPVPPAGARDYNRAIARALLEGAPARPAARARFATWLVPAAGLALAAAATIAFVATRHHEAPAVAVPTPPPRIEPHVAPQPPPPSPPAPVVTDVIDDGSLVAGTTTLTAGAAVPADVTLHAAAPVRLRLASLRVVIAASSDVRWSPIEHALVLERGQVELETQGSTARVVTPRFEVEIDDAAITVDAAEVRVGRGTARIVDRSRAPLARLEGGGTWRPLEIAHASASDLLARARAQFAAKDYPAAERTALRALASSPARGVEAEARIFLGDVAQAAGHLDVAVTRYQTVATKFADLPAAESALYDAARVELRRAHPAEARAFLDRYLARYPTGRFAADAHRELSKL